jgi:HEAT repeat protein
VTDKTKARIRPTLVILLWIWAGCVFLLIDLFFNVEEFDRVRPESKLYEGMRYAAHEMIGEPYEGTRLNDSLPPLAAGEREMRVQDVDALKTAMAKVEELAEARSFDGLVNQASNGVDPRVRIAALRALATVFGEQARPELLAVTHSDEETEKVRSQAARYVGRTGADSLECLAELIAADLPVRVRAGAVRGLAELGSEDATRVAVGVAKGEPSPLRTAALDALSHSTSAEAAPVLMASAADASLEPDTRVCACKGLGEGHRAEAVGTLSNVLADASNPPAVRVAAVDSLGRIGSDEALTIVEKACNDAVQEVASSARLARSRLRH